MTVHSERREETAEAAHSRSMMKFWEWVGFLFRRDDGAVLKDKNACFEEGQIFVELCFKIVEFHYQMKFMR